jgi:hypothetical protein
MQVIAGREVWFPRTPPAWHRLVAQGKIVIGPKEAVILQQADCPLPPVEVLLMWKEKFPGAVIAEIKACGNGPEAG